MVEPITKSEFLSQVTRCRARWDRLVGQVAPEELQLAGFCGEWSLKEVMAHILWHEREMVVLLETRSFGGSPYWELPTDERNERIHQEMQTLDLAAVTAQASQTYAALLDLLQGLPEQSLNEASAFPGMPEEWRPWEVLASNTYEHYADHSRQAEAWIARRQKGAAADHRSHPASGGPADRPGGGAIHHRR